MRTERFSDVMTRPWEWRRAIGGFTPPADRQDGVRYFHAYDVNDNAACDAITSLLVSCDDLNEGSPLCPDCIEIVRRLPAGREPR